MKPLKTFTLWNQSPVHPAYQACIDSWGDRLEIIRGDSGDQIPMMWADNERLRLLSDDTFYPDADVLYVDADCMPGVDFDNWEPDRTKAGFGTLRGGDFDIWACYRPAGLFDPYRYMYSHRDQYTNIGLYQDIVNYHLRKDVQRIHGYPDDLIIKHLNLSLSNN